MKKRIKCQGSVSRKSYPITGDDYSPSLKTWLGDKTIEIFHGGCIDCTMQASKGLGYCVGCQFFECNWSLTDLNDNHIKNKARLNIIREQARRLALISKK